MQHSSTEARLARLERELRLTRGAAAVAVLGVMVTLVIAQTPAEKSATQASAAQPQELTVRRLVVVDDEGRTRIILGQDPKDTQRRARAAGLTVYDAKGAERGGFSTLDDGSVVLALDAPAGVGHEMRDRLGMAVWPDGSSHLILLDNETRGVAKLMSDGKGGGGVQVFKWEEDRVHTKTITFDGEKVTTNQRGV